MPARDCREGSGLGRGAGGGQEVTMGGTQPIMEPRHLPIHSLAKFSGFSSSPRWFMAAFHQRQALKVNYLKPAKPRPHGPLRANKLLASSEKSKLD